MSLGYEETPLTLTLTLFDPRIDAQKIVLNLTLTLTLKPKLKNANLTLTLTLTLIAF